MSAISDDGLTVERRSGVEGLSLNQRVKKEIPAECVLGRDFSLVDV
ncbi:hypothetical protein [Prevotella corporis]|nr:hypothetical protein [Prevotella corporis]